MTGLLAILVTTAASVSAEPTRVAHVQIQQRVFPLITDFNANGLTESVLIRCERRDEDGVRQTLTTIELLEPIRPGSDRGALYEGRRYRYLPGGRFELSGFHPAPDGFDHGDTLLGSIQIRYGMYGLVQLPMLDRETGQRMPVSMFNIERGSFAIALGDVSFDDVSDDTARVHFQRATLGRKRPIAEQIALRHALGPMP